VIDWRAFWATYLLLALLVVALFIPQRHQAPPAPPHQPPAPTIVLEHR
jgi:hypothetical protein